MRMRTVRHLLLATSLVFLTLPTAAQQPSASPQALAPGDPMPVDPQVTRGQLPNGLRYYVRDAGVWAVPEYYKKLDAAIIQKAAKTYLSGANRVQVSLLPEVK